ncbi:DDE superfamily endonuclease domain-containing protein [Hirsutella rhossiliensis]|uniref:DDE superfamily endonuclease domain-containing protein n=1 Tax=Hirsutella rhossiliensis TaxID=111463 RepID=A0A9P8SCT7_9HYPO|nr:DDE superfamily endonuclease domain-containing protein [Hirsutella rhossiliensis]KAH0957229.1 DDE superfamily endonuclease domain-containing protein [Hirsutella rhossiliensis]
MGLVDGRARMPPTVVYTRRMANLLLSERGQETVGENWMMQEWYDRVAMAKQKWGILDEDVYNFDETGFQMGVIATARPGNREWVTVIESINCQGWALPAMVIFQGKVHQASWYEADVPKDWQIAVSDKGWTSDDLGLYCHVTPEFDNLWMSGAFAFENDIWAECSREDARRVNHIDKEDFLLLYIEARRQALSRRTSEVDSWPQAFPIQSDPGSVTVTSSG